MFSNPCAFFNNTGSLQGLPKNEIPTVKFTDVISPVIWARTETVDAAITVPIPWIVIGIDFWTAFATVTGTCAF